MSLTKFKKHDVKDFIEKLQPVESHYIHDKSKPQFLSSDLSIKKNFGDNKTASQKRTKK